MIRRITCRQLLDKQLRFMESWFGTPAPDQLVVFEVGTLEQFTERHIPRAIRLTSAAGLLRDTLPEVIIYGQTAQDTLPFHWANVLEATGYCEVYVLSGGKEAWAREGLTLQSGWVPADGFGETLPEPQSIAA